MSSLQPQMSDCGGRCEKGSGGIRVIQYQTIRRRSGMLSSLRLLIGPRLLSHDPLTPSSCLKKPLPDESPLPGWQKEKPAVSGDEQGGRRTLSRVSLIEAFRQRSLRSDASAHFLNCKHTCFSLLTFFYPASLFLCSFMIYLWECFVFTLRSGFKVGLWRAGRGQRKNKTRLRKQPLVVCSCVLGSIFYSSTHPKRQLIEEKGWIKEWRNVRNAESRGWK